MSLDQALLRLLAEMEDVDEFNTRLERIELQRCRKCPGVVAVRFVENEGGYTAWPISNCARPDLCGDKINGDVILCVTPVRRGFGR